jgi:hypothetical protein
MEGLNAKQLFRDRKLGADLPSIESPVGPETARSSSRAEHDLIQKRPMLRASLVQKSSQLEPRVPYVAMRWLAPC